MNIILIIIGLLAITIGVGAFVIDENNILSNRTKIGIAIAGVIIFIIGNSFAIIPTGHTGVKTTFGQINEVSLQNGFNLKIPFIQSIEKVNNKQQDIHFKDKIWSVTAENTNVYMEDIVVTYQINGEKSAWIYANISNYKENLISNTLVQSALKASSVLLSTDKIPNRSLIEPIAREQLQRALDEKYGKDVVFVTAVNIGNIDFEQAYNEALEKKQLAQKQFETTQIENKTSVEKAEANAKVKTLEAQAEADAKLIKARAEAEANEILTEKLTKAILLDKYINKWNGVLPKVVSDDEMILDISKVMEEVE